MKQNYILLTAMMIIIAVTVDRIEDAISDDLFKEEMTAFKDKGGRNTSVMGKALCERLNQLESNDVKPTNCGLIYK